MSSEMVAKKLPKMMFFALLRRTYLHFVTRSKSLTINKVRDYEQLTSKPIAGLQPSYSTTPILNNEAGDLGKLARVARDEHGADGEGVRGNEHVALANRI